MVPIRSRWHDSGVLEIPAGTPVKLAALAFARYGLRLEAEGISPGPIEPTVTIAGKHGHANQVRPRGPLMAKAPGTASKENTPRGGT